MPMSLSMCTDITKRAAGFSPAVRPAAATANDRPSYGLPHRRECLSRRGASVGSVALTSLLAAESQADDGTRSVPATASPLAPKPGHIPAKARSCIFLMMEGGPSHID